MSGRTIKLKLLSFTMELLVQQERMPAHHHSCASHVRRKTIWYPSSESTAQSTQSRVHAGMGPAPAIGCVDLLHAVINRDAQDVLHLSIYYQRPPGTRHRTAITRHVLQPQDRQKASGLLLRRRCPASFQQPGTCLEYLSMWAKMAQD